MISLSCPCGKRYRVPPEAEGKKATCKACGGTLIVPPAHLAAIAEANPQRAAPPPTQAPPTSEPRPKKKERTRTYWGDLARAFLFPSKHGGLAALIAVGILSALSMIPLPFAGLIFSALIFSYYFVVIVDVAGGDDGLPFVDFLSEGLSGAILAFIQFVGTGVILCIPGAVTFAIGVSQGWPDTTTWTATLIVGAIGMSLWPMALLAVAMGGLTVFLRIDLLILSALKVLPYYVLTLIVVGLTIVLESYTATPLNLGLPPLAAGAVQITLGGLIAAYCGLVSMQTIGLLYHHHSDRFAWSGG